MNNQNEFNSFSVIQFAWKWRKPLLIVTILAGISAFIFSLFIQPEYKSTAIVYASLHNSLLLDNVEIKSDIKRYGHEKETEQLMQILNSREFKDTIAHRFNLLEYYDIDTLHRYWRSLFYKELDGNIEIKRTQYGAITISVKDKNPKHAAILANAIVDELDLFKNKIEHERTQVTFDLLQLQIDEVNTRMITVNDSVQKLAKEGLFIYDLQVDRIMQQYATVLGQGNTAGAQRIQKEIDKIAKWGPTSVLLREELIYLIRRETQLKSLLWNVEMNLSGLLPSKFVVEKAIPIEKKIFPKKSVITFFSAIGAFVATFFLLLIIEKIKIATPMPKREE